MHSTSKTIMEEPLKERFSSEYLRLPAVIAGGDTDHARRLLRKYYGSRYPVAGEQPSTFTGAWFDEFDPSGTRDTHPNEFTGDDLVSLVLLNTPIGAKAGREILFERKEEISVLLSQIPTDVDLWNVSDPVDRSWPAWKLENLLREVNSIGLTKASKLIARKRPRLYPVNDKVVRTVLKSRKAYLKPLFNTLQDKELRKFLIASREAAELPDTVSVLRVFDVLVWMSAR